LHNSKKRKGSYKTAVKQALTEAKILEKIKVPIVMGGTSNNSLHNNTNEKVSPVCSSNENEKQDDHTIDNKDTGCEDANQLNVLENCEPVLYMKNVDVEPNISDPDQLTTSCSNSITSQLSNQLEEASFVHHYSPNDNDMEKGLPLSCIEDEKECEEEVSFEIVPQFTTSKLERNSPYHVLPTLLQDIDPSERTDEMSAFNTEVVAPNMASPSVPLSTNRSFVFTSSSPNTSYHSGNFSLACVSPYSEQSPDIKKSPLEPQIGSPAPQFCEPMESCYIEDNPVQGNSSCGISQEGNSGVFSSLLIKEEQFNDSDERVVDEGFSVNSIIQQMDEPMETNENDLQTFNQSDPIPESDMSSEALDGTLNTLALNNSPSSNHSIPSDLASLSPFEVDVSS